MERYQVGLMKTVVEEGPEDFDAIVDGALTRLQDLLPDALQLQLSIFQFQGPNLVPVGGAYSPLDFLQIGLRAKLERDIPFLLMITEVELSPGAEPYVIALPSQLTNVAIVSTKRLPPNFWGGEPDIEATKGRLASILAHMFGHLLNLPHDNDPQNVMYDFTEVEALDQMRQLRPEQVERLKHFLPIEAREKVAEEKRLRFALAQIVANLSVIARSVARVNPFQILWQLPTVLTAGFSVTIVLFFAPEIWDVASTLGLLAVSIFSIFAVVATTGALYRAFDLGPIRERTGGLSEATVVTTATAVTSVFLTMLFLYLILFLLVFLSAVTFFPATLKETWPTADPAVGVLEQLKLGMFVASMGVLTGSLGSGAGNQKLVRQVLFLDEE